MMKRPDLLVARARFLKGVLQLALCGALGCSSSNRNDAARSPDATQVGDASLDISGQNDAAWSPDSTQVGDASLDISTVTVAWPATPTSFWVRAQITREGTGHCWTYPYTCPTESSDTFLIRTEPDRTIVFGARGNAYRVPVAEDSQGYWVTQSCPSPASSTNTLGPGVNDLCFAIGENGFGGVFDTAYYTDYRYGPLRFRLTSSGLEGGAMAFVSFQLEDIGSLWSGPAQFSGVPDTEPPTVVVFYGFLTNLTVADRLNSEVLPLRASEPLPGNVTAWLVPSVGPTIPLDPIRTAFAPDLIVGFQPPANWATPNMAYTLGVDSFVDLAGNPGTPKLGFTFVPRAGLADGGASPDGGTEVGTEGD